MRGALVQELLYYGFSKEAVKERLPKLSEPQRETITEMQVEEKIALVGCQEIKDLY